MRHAFDPRIAILFNNSLPADTPSHAILHIRHPSSVIPRAMPSPFSTALILILCAAAARGGEQRILAEDDASSSEYKAGWKTAGGGTGLRDWTFQTLKAAGSEAHAGFYVAEAGKADLKGAAIRGKAFGLFANGVGFEAASAFRSFKKPLAIGQTFSFLMEHGEIVKKFAKDDPATGSIGITLRTGNASEKAGDYNKGARFEFGCYEGAKTYRIFDGEAAHDTGVPLTGGGLSVSLTLLAADMYDIEITSLADKKTTKLSTRKLGGAAGGKIESLCIFNRDGERSDAFFNGFQITGEIE